MIRHIVLFKLLEFPTPQGKREASDILQKELLKMKTRIHVIVDFEVGINFCPDDSAWDIVINSTFNSREDLETYRLHPDHQAFIVFNKNYSEQKAVVDFEITDTP